MSLVFHIIPIQTTDERSDRRSPKRNGIWNQEGIDRTCIAIFDPVVLILVLMLRAYLHINQHVNELDKKQLSQEAGRLPSDQTTNRQMAQRRWLGEAGIREV